MRYLLSAFIFLLLISCTKEDPIIDPQDDVTPPEIAELRYIANPFYEGPEGPIMEGDNFTVPLLGRLSVRFFVKDETNISEGELSMIVNNNPEIKEVFINQEMNVNKKDVSYGVVYDVFKVSLGMGVFYDYKVGDTMQFTLRFADDNGNESSINWTVEVVG